VTPGPFALKKKVKATSLTLLEKGDWPLKGKTLKRKPWEP